MIGAREAFILINTSVPPEFHSQVQVLLSLHTGLE